MKKRKIAPRNVLKRQGDFWTQGEALTEKDKALLQILINRAAALGYTPLVSDVPEAGLIKGRFRCWRDALKAAGLPSEKLPEQVALRKAARVLKEETNE